MFWDGGSSSLTPCLGLQESPPASTLEEGSFNTVGRARSPGAGWWPVGQNAGSEAVSGVPWSKDGGKYDQHLWGTARLICKAGLHSSGKVPSSRGHSFACIVAIGRCSRGKEGSGSMCQWLLDLYPKPSSWGCSAELSTCKVQTSF